MSVLDTLVENDGQMRPLRELLREHAALARALEALPLEVALEVVADLEGPAVDRLVDRTGLDLSPRLTAAHATWARAVLDAEAAAERPPVRWLTRWAFVALARAGLTCEARWERIFPTVIMRKPTEAITEAARTLPADRVLAVATDAMARDDVTAPQTGRAILAARDDEALARHVLAYRSAAWGPERLRKLLAPLADRPGVARALADDTSAAAPSLELISCESPASIEALAPAQRAQLERAGQLYGGTERPLAERLRDDGREGSFGGSCEHRVLATPDGAVRIDAWLYAGDSGTFFRAGTTEIVATLVQGGVRLADGEPAWLEDALARASVSETT